MSIQVSLKIRNFLKDNSETLDLSNMDLNCIPTEV